jgi:2-keto-4-pentenoate hydratase/2-oxohepta-3-ene-1,7-dioic acid hydratase in catechol pathway
MQIVRFIEQHQRLQDAWFAPTWGILEEDRVFPLAQAPYLGIQASGTARPLASVKLVAPATPTKLVCVGRNYAEHAAELGNEVPPEPLIFLKPPSTVIGPDAPVIYPAISTRVDHEGELALMIGTRCRNLSEENALHVIYGYTVANDVTARDLQRSDGQWTRGKGFDTFAPVGPWIDTDFGPANKGVRCLVNGEVRQDGSTSLLIYSIGRVLAHVTRFMTLEPGDLLLTGTPAGVGAVQPGDVMTVEVEGLGELRNPVISEDEARQRRLLP